MIRWLIVRDGKFYSQYGYTPEESRAAKFSTQAEATLAIQQLGTVARNAVVRQAKNPEQPATSAMMQSEYDPFGLRR